MRRLRWVALSAVSAAALAAPHPLAPLSAGEMRTAVGIIRSSGRLPASTSFSFIALDEPPKEAVLRQTAAHRRAFAVVYDRASNRTYEAIADLDDRSVASWKEIPGAQPPLGGRDSAVADRIARNDPRWGQAMRARGIRD